MHIFIITGGRIDKDFALSYIENEQPDCVMVADSGLNACYKMELMPDYIYGDFDSVSTDVYTFYAEKIPERIKRYPSRKNETDTELALREAVKLIEEVDTLLLLGEELSLPDENLAAAIERARQFQSKNNITILGATGTRFDHVFGNVQLLKVALEAGIDCQIVDENNRIRLLNKDFSMYEEEQFGDYISFLPFTERVEGLTLRGFEYDVEDWTMESGFARGVSNEIREDVVEVSMKKGILLMVESRD